MITKISARLVDFFIFHNKALEQTKEVYQYGCEILLATVINIIIVIVCGLVFGEIMLAITIFVLFAMIRSYSGGYHAKTYFKCNFLFSIMMTVAIVGVIIFEKNNQIAILIGVITNVFSVIIVSVFSPVENVNKLLNAEDKKKYKKISIMLVTLLIGVWVLFVGYSTKIALSISVSLLMVTISIVVEKLIKWKRRD